VRSWYRALLSPIEEQLLGWGVTADALTYAQLGVSVLAGAAFAVRAVFLAGWLTILAGTLDVLDGGLARRRGEADARGALLDSVADRWAEFAAFLGVGAFFRDSWMVIVVAIACFASFMVSYVRARAEGLGIAVTQGRAQRPERYVILGCGAWLSGLVAHLACPFTGRTEHPLLALAVSVLAVTAAWTALQRGRHAVRALAERAS
jgi:CDP-diacylglycerol--glycerol-3-phosphate 3-phosphatidyltransferase